MFKESKMADGKAEAFHAKEAISKKIWSRDYTGARTLLEDQRISSLFEHASEILIVCEILCSTEMELPNCGIDWYRVLRLSPLTKATAIEAEYQKLVSFLQPIKNDFPGTRLALNFVEDAFSVLSDPVKRAAFDSKRNGIGNDFYNMDFKVRCSDGLKSGNEAAIKRDIARCSDKPGSSRTKRTADDACVGICSVSSVEEDYADEKQKKICAEEATCVAAKMMSEEGNDLHSRLEEGSRSSSLHLVARKRYHSEFYDFENNRKAELFSTGQVWVAYDQENMPRRYGQIDKVIPDKSQLHVAWFRPCPQTLQEKRWCDAGFPVACGSFALEMSKITVSQPMMFSHKLSNGIKKQSIEVHPKKGEIWAIYRDWDMEWCSNPERRQKYGFEMVEILTDFLKDTGVKVACLVKVDGHRSVFQRYSKRGNELSFQIPVNKLFMFSHNVPAFRFVGGEIDGIANGMLELDPLAVPDDLGPDFSHVIVDFADARHRSSSCSDEASFTQLSNTSMNAVDSGGSNVRIQNHKPKWSSKDFVREQIWVIYDGPDAMPRLYARISDVISPTTVRVTYLEPHPVRDEEIQWVEESLPMACGIFRAGRATADLEMSRFSHLVKCDRSTKKSFYRIYPRKGEIWAMYENWNGNWKNSDHVRCQCRVVEILSDFSEEAGINICSLIEVKGCLTFFQRQLYEGFQLTRQLSGPEVLSFSHRIPAFTVVGIRDGKIPKGSWHLEPDALPPKSIN